MNRLWRNQIVHNIVCHPLAQIMFLVIRPFSAKHAEFAFDLIHDSSIDKSEILWQSW